MPRLEFLVAAERDLEAIAEFIEQDSGDRAVAVAVVDRIVAHCTRLARLPTRMGRERPELRAGYRSVPSGSHVIFFRYLSEGAGPRDVMCPRDVMQIIHILHGARDLDAYFREEDGATDEE